MDIWQTWQDKAALRKRIALNELNHPFLDCKFTVAAAFLFLKTYAHILMYIYIYNTHTYIYIYMYYVYTSC